MTQPSTHVATRRQNTPIQYRGKKSACIPQVLSNNRIRFLQWLLSEMQWASFMDWPELEIFFKLGEPEGRSDILLLEKTVKGFFNDNPSTSLKSVTFTGLESSMLVITVHKDVVITIH